MKDKHQNAKVHPSDCHTANPAISVGSRQKRSSRCQEMPGRVDCQTARCVGRRRPDNSKELGARCCYPERGCGSCETVVVLGLCARLPGWSRGSAATSLVTGLALIPLG